MKTCLPIGCICPAQWLKHWRALRVRAGFDRWQPDVLRHTFASYHLRHFKDYSALQYETGHRDQQFVANAVCGYARGRSCRVVLELRGSSRAKNTSRIKSLLAKWEKCGKLRKAAERMRGKSTTQTHDYEGP